MLHARAARNARGPDGRAPQRIARLPFVRIALLIELGRPKLHVPWRDFRQAMRVCRGLQVSYGYSEIVPNGLAGNDPPMLH